MEYSHEIVLPNEDIPFRMFIFEGRDGNYIREKHWHRSIEIFALFEGELEFYVNEVRYPLHPGEFMLVNSNEIHSIHSPRKNLTVVLQIPLSTFERYYTNEKFIYFSHSSRLHDEKVMELIRSMYQIYEKKAEPVFHAHLSSGGQIPEDGCGCGDGEKQQKTDQVIFHHRLHEE